MGDIDHLHDVAIAETLTCLQSMRLLVLRAYLS